MSTRRIHWAFETGNKKGRAGILGPSIFDRLPVEILVDVLLRCVKYEEENQYPEQWRLRCILSKVCRHWRQTIAQCPLFWTRIEIGDINLKRTLRNAGDRLPLEIHASGYEKRFVLEEFVNCVIPYAHRWKELHLATSSHACVRRVLALSTPKLETLDIDVDPRHLWAHEYICGPRVRNVKLRGITLPKGIAHFSNLTRLVLDDTTEYPSQPPPPLTSLGLVELLRASPNLETLDIQKFDCEAPNDCGLPLPLSNAIELPSLRNLVIHTPHDFTYRILGSIRAENLGRISISDDSEDWDGSVDATDITPFLVGKPSGGPCLLEHALANIGRYTEVWTTDSKPTVDVNGETLPFSVLYHPVSYKKDLAVRLHHLNWARPLFDIESLVIFKNVQVPIRLTLSSGFTALPSSGISPFAFFPSLTFLQLSGNPSNMLPVLSHIRNALEKPGVEWPCPQLSEIVFWGYWTWDPAERENMEKYLGRFVADLLDDAHPVAGQIVCGVPTLIAEITPRYKMTYDSALGRFA